MDKEDSCGAGRLFARGVLTPGSSVGYHAHEGDYEIYYILSGKGLGNDNGEECTLEAGDSFLTKNGSSHSLENIGDVDLEYIAIILFDKQ
jgi:mannose-6-phosphate isomerase-like protein (cupin superfamily)